ncbi:MAG: alpha/beta hydrolase [Pseudorhodoplanes sp.]|uniref:alpha/beta hydrolase n=1 Tax=Pseudorhodoplanes sp. TaxID=1934341 RepID=UPI003D0F2CC3
MTDFAALFKDQWSKLDPDTAAVLNRIYGGADGETPIFMRSPEGARELIDRLLPFYVSAGAPAIAHIEQRKIAAASGDIRIRLYDPGTSAPAPAIVFLHGGGFVVCDIDVYDGVARQLAKRSGMRIVSVDYGLAPEHPFPAPLHDCIAAIRWVAANGADWGIDPKRIAVAGDSAGANLALAATIALRDAGDSPVRGTACFYGCYAPDLNTESEKDYGGGPYLIMAPEMAWYWNHYLSGRQDRTNPLAAPLYADLAGLPPLFVTASEYDPLRNDSELLVEKLKAAGADFEFRLWPGTVHACVNLMGWIRAMSPRVDEVCAFLNRVTTKA